jgi:hypothetical protein
MCVFYLQVITTVCGTDAMCCNKVARINQSPCSEGGGVMTNKANVKYQAIVVDIVSVQQSQVYK